MAAERALGSKLPIASSQKQAEQLLQETAEAQQADLTLKGIHDLRGLLEAASRNRVLHPVHLDGVASSLEASCLSGFWNVHLECAQLTPLQPKYTHNMQFLGFFTGPFLI